MRTINILCKSVGLSNRRNIEQSDYRYAPINGVNWDRENNYSTMFNCGNRWIFFEDWPSLFFPSPSIIRLYLPILRIMKSIMTTLSVIYFILSISLECHFWSIIHFSPGRNNTVSWQLLIFSEGLPAGNSCCQRLKKCLLSSSRLQSLILLMYAFVLSVTVNPKIIENAFMCSSIIIFSYNIFWLSSLENLCIGINKIIELVLRRG